MAKIEYKITEREVSKKIVQDLAIKFVENYKKQIRNLETTRDEDMQTAFYFGHCMSVKTMIKTIKEFVAMNEKEREDKPQLKPYIKMVLFNLEALLDNIEKFDLIETNEQNKELN